jgi:FkbM family methyltransferase
MTRSPLRAVRRAGQTLTAFRNGQATLRDLVLGRPELTYLTKSDLKVTIPNVAGARVPVYELFVEDAYDLGVLLDGLPPDPVVLDIGGHVGSFSLSIARALPGARIHAFEASPTTASYLRRNVAGNGLGQQVTVHNVALSDHSGTLTFTDNESGSGQNGLTQDAGTGRQIEVPCLTFREALDAAGGAAQLVKIDTEGAEYSIILGSQPQDWQGVQKLVLEHHHVPGHSWAELEEFCTTSGLSVTRHDRSGPEHGTAWLART